MSKNAAASETSIVSVAGPGPAAVVEASPVVDPAEAPPAVSDLPRVGALRPPKDAKVKEGQQAPSELTLLAKGNQKIEDHFVGGFDGRDQNIKEIYAKQPGEYVIYRTVENDGVIVHLTDDPATKKRLRKLLLPMGTQRARVSALLHGWRNRDSYDCMVANALNSALEGDEAGAKATLEEARRGILNERFIRGQLQYVIGTAGACVCAILLLLGAYWQLIGPLSPYKSGGEIWVGGMAGAVGALFSIVLAKHHAVAPDLYSWNNVTDAVLRVLIGTLSGGALMLILMSGVLPEVKISGASLVGPEPNWKFVAAIGLVAGFVERIVPDLLVRAASRLGGTEGSDADDRPRDAEGSKPRVTDDGKAGK